MNADTQKKVKIGVGIAAGLLIIYLVTKSPSTTTNAGEDPTGNGSNPTGDVTPKFNAKAIADGLEAAMLVWDGTDETEIQNLLRNVNASQFAQIDKAFGKREYNSWTGFQLGGSDQPLKVWLKEELSTTDYNLLRLKYPNSL